jgi:CBS domain-containing membrane protein
MRTAALHDRAAVARVPGRAGWRDWLPAPMAVDARERLRAAAGALLGILATWLLAHALMPQGGGVPWLVAPIGASAVLVFAAARQPDGPSVVGGGRQHALGAGRRAACVHCS